MEMLLYLQKKWQDCGKDERTPETKSYKNRNLIYHKEGIKIRTGLWNKNTGVF